MISRVKLAGMFEEALTDVIGDFIPREQADRIYYEIVSSKECEKYLDVNGKDEVFLGFIFIEEGEKIGLKDVSVK